MNENNSIRIAIRIIIFFLLLSTVAIVRAQTAAEVFTLGGAWSPDGLLLATGDNTGAIEILNTVTHQSILKIQADQGNITTLAWSPDGKQLASGSSDETVKIWDIERKELIHTLSGHGQGVATIAWSPDGHFLYTGTGDPDYAPALRKWDAVTGDLLNTVKGVAGKLVLSRDGMTIFMLQGSGVIALNTQTFERIGGFALSSDNQENFVAVSKISLDPNNHHFAVGYINGWVRVWDIATESVVAQYEAHDQHPLCCHGEADKASEVTAVYLDETTLTSVTQDGTFRVWELSSNELLQNTQAAITTRRTFFSPSGGRLAIVGAGETNTTLTNVQILVPDPSLTGLQRLISRCMSSKNAKVSIPVTTIAKVPDFVAQVKALPANTIPAACQADLIAVAEALIAQQ